MKNYQNAQILHDICPKMPEFYVIIAGKIFFSNFGRARSPPPDPVAYAYEEVKKNVRSAWRSFPGAQMQQLLVLSLSLH